MAARKKANRKKDELKFLRRFLWVVCATLLALNFLFPIGHKGAEHGGAAQAGAEHAGIDSFFGFYGLAGFLAFCFIIAATKYLQNLLGRPEGYYKPFSIDSEKLPPEQWEDKP